MILQGSPRSLFYHTTLLPSLPLSRRIISGGRYGEVRVWSLEAAISGCEFEEEIAESRELRLHDRSTAVGQVKLLRAQAGIMRDREASGSDANAETIALFLSNWEEICSLLRSILIFGIVIS